MSFFTEIFQRFSSKAKKPEILHQSDIKFSALIQNIQSDIIKANQSLECVGIKYIEQFFDKKPATNNVNTINNKFNAIGKTLDAGDTQTANKLLLDLKDDMNALHKSSEGTGTHYLPKMTTFEMPMLLNGVWINETKTIPLLALSPIAMPKIKALTFTSSLENIHLEEEEVYVRLFQNNNNSSNKHSTKTRNRNRNRNRNKKLANDNLTTLEISISPEQSSAELNEVITHYEQILRAN